VRVEQIVWNLMSNALKFTPPGGSIELRLSQGAGEARLDVTDSGQGIAPDFIGEVFEMFRQADRSTTRAHGGMGIGLALVKHLAEEQGGRVAAVSEGIGRGSRFSVWLPLADGTPREGAPDEGLPMLHGLHLLVVDDAVDALESFSALLRLEGAEVTAVSSAQQALAALETAGRVDVILSDVAMPEMDGYELIRRVRADPRTERLPAIALTGFGRSEDAHRALTAGFDAHLAKPVQIEHLVVALQRVPRPGGAESGNTA
jgi:two-component system CheB/CheR fusion protein